MTRSVRTLVVSLAVLATVGIAAANAHSPSITGYPNQINKVDLSGYVLQTSYSLGANTGFTFEQRYGAAKVDANALPFHTGDAVYTSNYVAMPVGHKQLMVTWYQNDGSINDVFVMNFDTGVVSDVAPHSDLKLPSLGTVKIVKRGMNRIP